MPSEVAQSAHTSELPSNIEDQEPSTPLPTPLIMPSPQSLDQGQFGRGRKGGEGRERGRGCRATRDDLLIYHRCKYMIDDHNKRRRFLHMTHISGFIYELDNLCT